MICFNCAFFNSLSWAKNFIKIAFLCCCMICFYCDCLNCAKNFIVVATS
jgi:hypothetical protein